MWLLSLIHTLASEMGRVKHCNRALTKRPIPYTVMKALAMAMSMGLNLPAGRKSTPTPIRLVFRVSE